MSSIPLETILGAALPGLPRQSGAVIHALVESGGRVASAPAFAAALGFRSRFGLARLLARTGLPPLRELADWIRVLELLWWAEATGTSLERLAHARGVDPPACHRVVRRTTGVSWSVTRTRGFSWALLEFLRRARSRPRPRAGVPHDGPLVPTA
jgi:hypothetical protein